MVTVDWMEYLVDSCQLLLDEISSLMMASVEIPSPMMANIGI